MGASLHTTVAPYRKLVVSAAGAETILTTGASTSFNIGVPSGIEDLKPKDLKSIWSASEGSTKANYIVLTCYATANDNDTCEMDIYGIADGGAPERIASVIWIFGTARHTSSTVLWADTCTVSTDSSIGGVTVSDSGNNFIAKLTFDLTGYRYLYAIAHGTATGAATDITVLMRPF